MGPKSIRLGLHVATHALTALIRPQIYEQAAEATFRWKLRRGGSAVHLLVHGRKNGLPGPGVAEADVETKSLAIYPMLGDRIGGRGARITESAISPTRYAPSASAAGSNRLSDAG